MPTMDVRDRLQHHLRVLVDEVGPRPAGSPANGRATDHVRRVLTAAGLRVRALPFHTAWWDPSPSRLHLPDGEVVELLANPFSPPGTVEGPVVHLEDHAALAAHVGPAGGGEVLVLGLPLGGEPIMPATFPFLQVPEQRQLVATLEALHPAAVVAVSPIAATTPTFEDPTLSFPSVTVEPSMAQRLEPGTSLRIEVGGRTLAGRGVTVVGRTTPSGPRLVVSAHVDSKVTTPGAFDNAASLAAVLTLVEVAGPDLGPVEVVAFNGEDHHDSAGEVAWLDATDLDEVTGVINVDGAGVAGRRTGVTCLACPAELEEHVLGWARHRPGWTAMAPWFESDHAIFAMRGIPAVAITSEDVHDLLATVAHTPADTLDVLDLDVLVDLVAGLRELVPQVVGARLRAA